jgi:DNA repair protein RecO (recombination protein O)
MLARVNGIVLQTIKYSENSLIVKIYTEQKGIQSYFIKSVKSKRSRFKQVYFQPLTILEFVAFSSEKRGIHTIKEIAVNSQFRTIHFEVSKSAQALFIAEVLTKVLKESEPNFGLYCFIKGSLEFLDGLQENTADFHILFLTNLSVHLGFAPFNNYSEHDCYFNMHEGKFEERKIAGMQYIDEPLSRIFSEIMNCGYEQYNTIHLHYSQRKELLLKILEFFRIHISGFGVCNSQIVLEEVFH